MWQIIGTGMNADVTLAMGPQTSKRDIPLGTYVTDGIRKYRWGHVALAAYKLGAVVVQSTTAKEVASTYFASANWVDGTRSWGKVGDSEIYLYSCLLLSANRYEDGSICIVSGTGKGHAYGITSYQNPVAGTRMRVSLDHPLEAAIGRDTQAVLVPNEYYGLKLPATSGSYVTGLVSPRGAITGSDGAVSDTSSYQWLQVTGPGVAYHSSVIAINRLLTHTLSGRVLHALSSNTSSVQLARVPVARALQARLAAENYCAVRWMIE